MISSPKQQINCGFRIKNYLYKDLRLILRVLRIQYTEFNTPQSAVNTSATDGDCCLLPRLIAGAWAPEQTPVSSGLVSV